MKQSGLACRQAGFTLVETLLVASIGSVAAVLLIYILVSSNSLYLTQSAKTTQKISLNDASKDLKDSIRSSAFVQNNCPLDTQYVTSNSVLVLALPSLDSSGNIIESVFDCLVIKEDPASSLFLKKIVVVDPTSSRLSSTNILVNNLQSINFEYKDHDGLAVSASLAQKIKYTINLSQKAAQIENNSISGEVNLRND